MRDEAAWQEIPARMKRRNPYADATMLRLGQLGPGRTRGVRLRLMEIRRHDKRPTEWFLELNFTCREPGRAYQAQARADFGEAPPLRASLTVVQGRRSAAGPMPLVEAGQPREVDFLLEVEPETEWLTFWVAPEGADGVPGQLAGEVRLRHPADDRPASELVTARLPSVRTVVRQSLVGAFRRAASPPLVLLGGLMRSEDPVEKLDLFRKVVDLGADAWLLEAGARDIAWCEEIVRDFPALDFDRLSLDDPADASLAAFHPRCPTGTVRRCLDLALERQLAPASPEAGRRWKEMVKGAAVVLGRRDRSLLDDVVATAAASADPAHRTLVTSLVEWAGRQTMPSLRPLPETLETYLRRIAGDDIAGAERAAFEVMLHYDMVAVAVRRD